MIYIAFNKCDKAPASQREAGVVARDRLFSLFGIKAEAKKAENGKPYIDDKRYHFSISHTVSVAVCALRCKEENYDLPEDIFTIFEDGDGEIGIDIEAIPTDSDLERFNRIAKRYFKKSFDSSKDFIYHWTKSEALCKYHGSSLAESFKADFNDKAFFCGEIELDTQKYIISVCY